MDIGIKRLSHYKWITTAWLLALSLVLVSCGGSSGSNLIQPSTPQLPVEQAQGGFQLISNSTKSSRVDIQTAIDSLRGENLPATALFAVSSYVLEYLTLDSNNELIKVSGLLVIPDKKTPSPILSYQHATIFKNADAPTSHLSASEDAIEIALASLGYIVFSADYIGYGASLGKPHPYLLKKPSSDVVLDLLQVGKKWLDFQNIQTTNQLFMTGYSQGGYVTMAALKDLQENPRDGLVATAAVMGAGPYDVQTTLETQIGALNIPSLVQGLFIDLILDRLVPSDEISFDGTILEHFFDNDGQDDVHNWLPDIAIKLIHGENDRTVPIESAISTFNAMTALGADVDLVRCSANPSSHLNCVLPYIELVIEHFGSLRP